jgi:hypothetical protein
VEALLKGAHKAFAADELHSIGIRTRGAVRVRGGRGGALPEDRRLAPADESPPP